MTAFFSRKKSFMIFSKLFSSKKKLPIKIGVLYVCTGKYHKFWDGFYTSAHHFFCKNSDVHYFVFSDFAINKFDNQQVNHIPQEKPRCFNHCICFEAMINCFRLTSVIKFCAILLKIPSSYGLIENPSVI